MCILTSAETGRASNGPTTVSSSYPVTTDKVPWLNNQVLFCLIPKCWVPLPCKPAKWPKLANLVLCGNPGHLTILIAWSLSYTNSSGSLFLSVALVGPAWGSDSSVWPWVHVTNKPPLISSVQCQERESFIIKGLIGGGLGNGREGQTGLVQIPALHRLFHETWANGFRFSEPKTAFCIVWKIE
jgi:hypothetical protein